VSSINVINIKHPSASSNAITLAADGSAFINTGVLGSRNRIINGDMRIDQRNAGASVTVTSGGGYFYPVDRFLGFNNTGVNFTAQRVSDAPAGFSNSARLTFGSAISLSTTNEATFQQIIEGFNVADLGWGSAGAQSITVGFWVKASFTGTNSIGFANDGGNRAYATTYTINAANTWEYKTITVPGDTGGTWNTTNLSGLFLRFNLAAGSNFAVSSNNTWSTRTGAYNASDSIYGTRAVGTPTSISAGATWQVTGIQLEAGTVATAFERRNYAQELSLCKRYFEPSGYAMGNSVTTSTMDMVYSFEVEKRTDVTYVFVNGTNAVTQSNRAGTNITSVNSAFRLDNRKAGFRLNVADTGLNVGTACFALANGAFAFSAEL
jgi:hypothetical protein